MIVASVIVDVAVMQTDRPFDYEVPDRWQEVIQPGMRVVVPFGPRHVQGFVLDVKEEAEIRKLKPIVEPMDIVPVLNEELLSLADWLTAESLCFKISALQVMLPAAMKAKYQKFIRKTREQSVQPAVESLFNNREEIPWEEATDAGKLSDIRKEVKNGTLEVIYSVKSKGRKKTVRMVKCTLSENELAEIVNIMPKNAVKQKEALLVFTGRTHHWLSLKETGISSATAKSLIEKGFLEEKQEEMYRDPLGGQHFEPDKPLMLTENQQKAIRPILDNLNAGTSGTFLLHGVTGSGKTEIYLQSISRVIEKGQEAILLVPEISLTPQMTERFKRRFGNDVAVLHSGLSTGEKYDEWRKISRKEVKVVVGARSAIFAPFENIGLIIIDEEHETSYKQEENPRYHARDVAIQRSFHYNCPVILGSATPSLESYARAKKGVYTLLSLDQRVNDRPLPTVDIVDMREELREGNRSMFSRTLFEKIKDRLEKGEQTVLFLNKRGYSSFIMCRDCGYVAGCPHCDVSMTYHRHRHQLKCHYCGYEEAAPYVCPECTSEHIRHFGTGTQKVEEELLKLLPEARIIRMDVDTTGTKGAHEKLLRKFGDKEADILLGTQMIAKGLDFPDITLVGVLSADTMLHLPDFRSSEKTFQLLTQVSGRAGRHTLPGEVVVQTYTPEHYSIQLAAEQNYESFYQQEMMMRKMGGYPPFYFLALITISHTEAIEAASAANKIVTKIKPALSSAAVILGPVASPIARINNRYRWQCLIKYKREPKLTEILKKVLEHYTKQGKSNGLIVSIDIHPYVLM
ncbi:primosomal protein N' [Domibacillus epiphyticus]|uniref:Replication restart protein PriA n=1 Tax=Domibacillus epiphyticus TaxID=1714355 RepID=A0A1V2AC31_9BACI|nr:primosomal protein N' [Domibacillus epiphyticus]OMP68551.1 primosomal protein N' [Domibacillus epiphyticus]